MKTIIYKLLLIKTLILSCFFAFADSDPIFFLSPWGGLHTFKYETQISTNLESPVKGNTKRFTEFGGGIKFTYASSKEVFLRSEIAYLNKSFVDPYEFEDINHNPIGIYPIVNKFSFISLPAELQFNIYWKNSNVYLIGGFHMAYLQKQKTYANLPDIVNNVPVSPYNINNIDKFKKLCFGYNLGIGMEYKLNSTLSIFAEYRYEKDFTDIYKNNKYYNRKLRAGYFSLGIKFGIF